MARMRAVLHHADPLDKCKERPCSTVGEIALGTVHQLQSRLAGTVTVADGVDLTEPTGEIWDADQ
jgi:hypothetical protein